MRYIARYAGDQNSVFGDSPEEAKDNLRQGPGLYGKPPAPWQIKTKARESREHSNAKK